MLIGGAPTPSTTVQPLQLQEMETVIAVVETHLVTTLYTCCTRGYRSLYKVYKIRNKEGYYNMKDVMLVKLGVMFIYLYCILINLSKILLILP